MMGFQFDGIKKFKDLELVRSLSNLFRDEFLVRVQRTIYGENITLIIDNPFQFYLKGMLKVSASSSSGASHFLRRLPLCSAEVARPSSRSPRPGAALRPKALTGAARDHVRSASAQSFSEPRLLPLTCPEDRE